ncbi:MAG: GAF domain-containing protein [Candidatus Promineifilaceae bacterium]
MPETPLDGRVKQLFIEVQSPEQDLFSWVVHNQQHWVINELPFTRLPESFVTTFLPAVPVIIVPLKVQSQVIGLLVADNHVHHEPITPARLKALLNLIDSGAIAINNGRLLHESEQSRQRLNALYKAGKILVSNSDPRLIWQDMIKELHKITNAFQVRMVLVDKEQGTARDLFIAGNEANHPASAIRPNGYSMQIVHTGEPFIIEDSADETLHANPTFHERGIAAAVGLPILLHGTTLGVVWIYFDAKREITTTELEDFQVYVNKSALAYDRAQRIIDLEKLRHSAKVLARPVDIQATSQDIVQQAVELLGSHSAALWAYDHGASKFILDQTKAHNIPKGLWQKFLQSEPRPGQTAHAVLKQQYIEVYDIEDSDNRYLSSSTQNLLKTAGVKSMQGVALTIGNEQLGVLYLNRDYPGSFAKREEEVLKLYAQQAALALNNARLMERANNARQAVGVITSKITTHDSTLDDTLEAVIDGVQEALRCDAVTLYIYVEENDEFIFPPKWRGVNDLVSAQQLDHVERGSIVYDVIYADEPMIADDVEIHPAFSKTRFTKAEGIRSSVGIALKIGRARVGAMFANYRSLHRFQSEEIKDIELLANQAAIAIHNARLLDRERLQTRMLQSLNTAAQSVTNSLELDDTLQSILAETYRIFAIQNRKIVHTSIWLIEKDTDIRFVSQPPVTNPQSVLFGKTRIVNWSKGVDGAKIGVTGQVLKSGQVEIVNDVLQHDEYIPANLETRAELAVPIKFSNDVVGALNVEGNRVGFFTEQDAEMLLMLAEQTAVAISNARNHQSIVTLRNVATHLSGDLDLRSVIRQVMQAAVNLTYSDAAWMVFWDGDKNQFTDAYRLVDGDNIELYDTTARVDGGWTVQIIQGGKSEIFNHLADQPQINPTVLRKQRKAMIGVPVKTPDRVTAVLYVCSYRPRHYTSRHSELLESLVGQSGVAIDRVYAYEELQKTKRVIGARTALAWMGMTSSRWRHQIEQHALGIRNSVFLIKDQWIGRLDRSSDKVYLEDKLNDIEMLSNQILSHEITPPLGSNAENVHINELVRERVSQLWQNEPYNRFARPILELDATRNIKVKSSTDWLRLALDNLIDNALEAMAKAKTAVPHLWIRTRAREGFVELHIRDNGPGIPQRVLDSLNTPKLEPKVEDGNLGRGLLMIQAIAEAYQGDFIIQTSDSGTTVIITLKDV